MKYSIIIPCYNEEDNIEKLINLLSSKSYLYDIEWIIVENGSKDDTRTLLNNICKDKKNFKLVYIDQNQGYGYGIEQGLKNTSGNYVGWLHADMQVSPDSMLEFIKLNELFKETKNFYKGSRKNRKFIDNFFTFFMSVFSTLLFQTFLSDIGAIPVLFHRDLMNKLDKIPHDFSIETYVYYIAKKENYKIIRLPIYMNEREKGESSWDTGIFSKIKQSWRIIKALIKIRLKKETNYEKSRTFLKNFK